MKNVEVALFNGLLVDYAHKIGAQIIVRGLRAATDFEYELQIAHANADLAPDIDTVFLPTRTQLRIHLRVARPRDREPRRRREPLCAARGVRSPQGEVRRDPEALFAVTRDVVQPFHGPRAERARRRRRGAVAQASRGGARPPSLIVAQAWA